MTKWDIYNNFKTVEADLTVLLRYVELDEKNYSTTSAEIKKIILLSSSFLEYSSHYIAEELQEKITNTKNKSIVSQLFSITEKHQCPLSNLTPKIYEIIFTPWRSINKNENRYEFMWWNAYNACKHKKSDSRIEDIQFFKAAIDSVAALFTTTVFLTSETTTNMFWQPTDLLKIQTLNNSKHHIYYTKQESLRHQIWPDFKI